MLLTEVECCFTSTGTVGLLGTGAEDGHLDFHTPPERSLCSFKHSDGAGFLKTYGTRGEERMVNSRA